MKWPRSCATASILGVMLLPLACIVATAEPVSNITFTAFDLETTGFDSDSGRIVEIAAVRFRNGLKIDQKTWLINPQRPIPESASRIHGITDETVARSPDFKEVLAEFAEFINDDILLAHNARFDIRFISAETERNNLQTPTNAVIDTVRLARAWFPDSEAFNLDHLVDYLGLQNEPSHRALPDANHIMQMFVAGTVRQPPQYDKDDLLRHAGGALSFDK